MTVFGSKGHEISSVEIDNCVSQSEMLRYFSLLVQVKVKFLTMVGTAVHLK